MKFLADRMLGKLSKKLRMLGFDTLYFNNVDEKYLLDIILMEERILLTRDRELHSIAIKKGYKSFLLKSNYWQSQLRAVFQRFKLRPEMVKPFSRCSRCNAELEAVSPETVKNEVPDYVFFTQEEFLRCRGCGRIYWKGTHVPKIMDTLRDFMGGLSHDG
ncbi:MAG: Mut7-C RNAse domain-containing protein [Kosmotoga sp.]|uniref:Mut7-C RNAse domain-containing protein n=1 Tax=Kosmotoga sp. TaxID=1955248 RepID=UPI001DD0F445|nr:Mut7-C RNAse domain-containing protein [Kosmotoga sp.]MBO8166222.1 Mut7-C RNAse domain-containing protein [Kosmotoga sp.]